MQLQVRGDDRGRELGVGCGAGAGAPDLRGDVVEFFAVLGVAETEWSVEEL